MVNQQRLHDVLVHMCSKLEQNCHTNAGVGVYKVVQNQARSFGEVEEREIWYFSVEGYDQLEKLQK